MMQPVMANQLPDVWISDSRIQFIEKGACIVHLLEIQLLKLNIVCRFAKHAPVSLK
jgi:hypothetical protein